MVNWTNVSCTASTACVFSELNLEIKAAWYTLSSNWPPSSLLLMLYAFLLGPCLETLTLSATSGLYNTLPFIQETCIFAEASSTLPSISCGFNIYSLKFEKFKIIVE